MEGLSGKKALKQLMMLIPSYIICITLNFFRPNQGPLRPIAPQLPPGPPGPPPRPPRPTLNAASASIVAPPPPPSPVNSSPKGGHMHRAKDSESFHDA